VPGEEPASLPKHRPQAGANLLLPLAGKAGPKGWMKASDRAVAGHNSRAAEAGFISRIAGR
jgi:hypothetical protein